MVFWNKDLLFCDINPTCYAISVKKEIIKRHLLDFKKRAMIATNTQEKALPNLVYAISSNMIKRAKGVDLASQFNKATNIDIACKTINGLIIRPGEVFSFWKLVGKISEKKGYRAGRVIEKNKLVLGIGGGICNLANTIHLLVVHSPLSIIEFHAHSDALAPDEGHRIPLSSGTSVSYNNVDYRFKNETDQSFQLRLWCDGEMLHSEIRSEKNLPWSYNILEEEHHFKNVKGKYYRLSKIYKETLNQDTGKTIEKKMILDNYSEVMFDYDLIPKEQIRQD